MNPILVEVVPEYRGLDEESAGNYYRSGSRDALLRAEVLNPFDEALRDSAGYNDKFPEGKETVDIALEGFNFSVEVQHTKKRPGYKEIFEDMDNYLRARLDDYESGNRPRGVLTLEEEPYISAFSLLERLDGMRESVLSEGVKKTIVSPAPIQTDSIVIPLGQDISSLNGMNAHRYLEALALSESYRSFISGFEGELIGLTGFDNKHPPQETEHLYKRLGDHIFHVKSVPYNSIGYGTALAGLDREPPKRKPEKAGELVLVTRGIESPAAERYRPKRREGDCLVRLRELATRMDELKEENTKVAVRQKPILHYPIV